MRPVAILVFFAVFAACNTEKDESINIAVYPSTKACTIKDKPIDCGTLGAYIRDEMKATAGRLITVSYAGTATASKDDTSLEQIAALIKETGYSNVRVIRYDMK